MVINAINAFFLIVGLVIDQTMEELALFALHGSKFYLQAERYFLWKCEVSLSTATRNFSLDLSQATNLQPRINWLFITTI